MSDNRIGQFTDVGMVWPEVNIFGHKYERGVGAIAPIGGGQFVVLPVNFVDDGTLAGLRGKLPADIVEPAVYPPPIEGFEDDSGE